MALLPLGRLAWSAPHPTKPVLTAPWRVPLPRLVQITARVPPAEGRGGGGGGGGHVGAGAGGRGGSAGGVGGGSGGCVDVSVDISIAGDE